MHYFPRSNLYILSLFRFFFRFSNPGKTVPQKLFEPWSICMYITLRFIFKQPHIHPIFIDIHSLYIVPTCALPSPVIIRRMLSMCPLQVLFNYRFLCNLRAEKCMPSLTPSHYTNTNHRPAQPILYIYAQLTHWCDIIQFYTQEILSSNLGRLIKS